MDASGTRWLSLLFATMFLTIMVSGEMGFAGIVREATEREFVVNEEGLFEEDVEAVIEKAMEILQQENFEYKREDCSISITEYGVFHITERGGSKQYVTVIQRGPGGYPVKTNIPLELAKEYHLKLLFNTEEHILILWKDIDKQIFSISHRWKNLLQPVQAEDCENDIHRKSIRPACYNIWNLNDEWERRAKMIVHNLLQENPNFIVFQEVRYNIIDEYEYKHVLKERTRFQIEELRKHFLEQSNEQWQYHYHPAMSYLDRFHTDEGLAIFSRFPIIDWSYLTLSRDLDDREDAHQRVILRTLLETPLGPIHVFNTHFALTEEARTRAVVELWEWIQQFETPHILMGDLNAEPNDPAIEFLLGTKEINGITGDFVDVTSLIPGAPEELTFPSWEPIKRIDFILVRGFTKAFDYKLMGTIPTERKPNTIPTEEDDNNLWSSDHFGVTCTLEN